ncbi:MAG TPA: FtsX-like permease family protein, partial [Terriglobales bacterium]|nr:FtsX-like permease family protein [Terriglobales bacterium]
SLSMPATPNTTAAETRARLRQFDQTMQHVPGVQAVSVTLGSRPMIHDSSLPLWIQGEPKPANDNDMHAAMFYLAEAGFQQAMGITLLRGRFLGPQDDEHAPRVIVVDNDFASTYLPGQYAIGKLVNLEQFDVQAQIVGVVEHVKQWGPAGDPKAAIEPQFFYPFMQLPEKLMPMVAGGVAVVLRTYGDPAAVMSAVRDAVRRTDPREVVYNVDTMDEVWGRSMAARRVTMVLLAGLAALALVLACVGTYGVASYLVGQRTQEIGVRMALGAGRKDILRMVLTEGAKMAALGAIAGTAAALVLTRLMASQLFGVSAHDPSTFAGVAALLISITIAACYLPAQRAMRVDPAVALRQQ